MVRPRRAIRGFILGFGTLAIFGGYAIYFPELFPTRLRATGVSFCYNVGRYLAALINMIPTQVFRIFRSRGWAELRAYRATAISMSLIYLIGSAVMVFAPETKGKPLPTDDDAQTPAES